MPKAYNLTEFGKASDQNLCLHITGDPKKAGALICAMPRAPDGVYCQQHRDLCVRVVKISE